MTIHDKIECARVKIGMSEERFAELTGIPASYWLHPSHELSTSQLANVMEILKRPADNVPQYGFGR